MCLPSPIWIRHKVIVPLVDGKGVLPIKWRKKLQEGTYGPLGTAFSSGVVITSDGESKYVPFVWAASVDSVKFLKTMPVKTRSGELAVPKASELSFFPGGNVNLSGASPTARTIRLNIQKGEDVFMDYSNILPGDNLDLSDVTKTPELIQGVKAQLLKFDWNPAPPARGFVRTISAMTEDFLTAEVNLVFKLQQEPELIVDQDTIYVDANGGKALTTVNVSTNFNEWTATCNSDWLHPDHLTGMVGITTITVDVDKNPSAGKRMSSIDIESDKGNLKKRVVFVQQAAAPSLSVDKEAIELATAGGTGIASFIVSTNLESWTATSSADWLTINPTTGGEGNNSITISATENTLKSKRTATITIKAGNLTKLVTVTQDDWVPILEVGQLYFKLPAEGGLQVASVNVTTNLDWKVESSDESMLVVTPFSGNPGTHSLDIHLTNNKNSSSRYATATITAGDLKKVIVVEQMGQSVPNVSIEDLDNQQSGEVNGGQL